MRERLADVAERRGRYAGGGERRLPVGARPRAQSLGEERRELNAVAHTVWIRSEAFVVRQVERVAELAARFQGRAEVVLADTIGVATPPAARSLLERTGAEGFHGHNTRNTGYANCLAAVDAGARLLDASVGGLGGCPYAPRATGNVATEDLVYLLEGEGVETGVDLDALIGVAEWLAGVLGRDLPGLVQRAGNFAL